MKYDTKEKFVTSYSFGKDSTLATYEAIKNNKKPKKLIYMNNINKKHKHILEIQDEIIERVSSSLKIPIGKINTNRESYKKDFEFALKKEKIDEVSYCVFGDIDIEGHYKWCTERCDRVGLKAYFPLWGMNRKSVVYRFVELGFKAIITSLDTSRMDKNFLGEELTLSLLEKMEKNGIDICGENGEFHTFVYDGPIYKEKIEFKKNGTIKTNNYISLEIE